MNNYSFSDIKKKLSPSLKMKLDHIKRFLYQGNASVLVGAGFSKNAEMDVSVSMKDWYSLGMDFYRKLYGKESTEINPINLASMVEASFGRNELDEMIINSLPDDRVYPGELHKSLLKLNWKDIFTTNYDTLLERAITDAERHYEVVTNKETLLYKTSPRIIKLHGSFKNVRPFIITEEDYRTYPSKYPEFVNTVRQSLIEGILCLVGFSGNDPNFLEWIGWLRDVMGDHAVPVYLITFNKELHISEVKLNEKRGISIINLAEIESFNETDIKEAHKFLFEYLEENEEDIEVWRGFFTDYNLRDNEGLEKTIAEMKRIRESYPGWLLLPQKYFRDFDDINNMLRFVNDLSLYKNDKHILLSFLFEIDWRLNISLSPKLDCYVQLLEDLLDSYHPMNKTEENQYDSLLITLLVTYRKRFEIDKFNGIDKLIESNINRMSNDNVRRYYYEKSLYYLMILDYEAVKEILNKWSVLKYDYHGILCKSCIYAEIGMEREALVLLNETLQNIRLQLLIKSTSPLLITSRSLIEECIRIYNYNNGLFQSYINTSSNKFNDVVRYFKQEILNEEAKKSRFKSIKHDFNIKKFTLNWSFESGINRSYLNAYKYIQAHELLGYPLGLTNLTLNENEFEYIISHYMRYDVLYPLLFFGRTNSSNLVNKCISRGVLINLSTECANKLFDLYFENINDIINNKKTPQYIRFGNVILPLLSRLSTKISNDRIIKLFKFYIDNYSNNKFYKNVDFITIYNSLSLSEMNEILRVLFTQSINKSLDIYIPFPKYGYNNFTISKEIIDIIVEGLSSSDNNVSNTAYIRITKIYKHITEEERSYLNRVIYQWRNNGEFKGNKLYSLRLLPYNQEVDRFDINSLIKDGISSLVVLDKLNDNDTVGLENLITKIEDLYPIIEYILPSDNEKIVSFLTEFLRKNTCEFYSQDQDPILRGIRCNSNELLNSIYKYVLMLNNWESISKTIRDEFIMILCELSDYNLKTILILSLLSQYLNTSQMSNLFEKIDMSLSNSDNSIFSDAANALVNLTKKGVDVQNNIDKIINYLETTISEITSDYINILTSLILVKGINISTIRKLIKSFNKLYYNVQRSSISEEFKVDIYYDMNLLLGVLSVLKPSMKIDKNILKQINSENAFNDVKVAYEIGQYMAKDKIKI